jgi:hypothetical protein
MVTTLMRRLAIILVLFALASGAAYQNALEHHELIMSWFWVRCSIGGFIAGMAFGVLTIILDVIRSWRE